MPKLTKRGRQTHKNGTIGERVRKVRDKDTPQGRLFRQQHDLERNMLRLRVLTPKSKGRRLREQRDRPASRLNGETKDAREVRLLDLRDRQAFRLDSETEDAREVRFLARGIDKPGR